VCGTLNVLELCRVKNARMIFASSCGVYGPVGGQPVPETRTPNPISLYAWSKWLGEQLCAAYARVYGVSCVILRLFNVYGGGQQGSWLIPSLVGAARAGRMVVLRSPQSRRDFVHVSDAVRAFENAAAYGKGFDVFNVGSGRLASVREVVEWFGTALGNPIPYECARNTQEAVEEIVADLTRVTQHLQWTPVITLEEGLAEVARCAQG
jgi:nucleoside-diphosphate-sugar epimerase